MVFGVICLFMVLACGAAETESNGNSPPEPDATVPDCARATVQNAINAAADGDTIVCPSGSWTWSDTVTIPSNKGITLVGQGIGKTIITDGTAGGPSGPSMLVINTDEPHAQTRITGFTFNEPNGRTGILINKGATTTDIRIDHNRFEKGEATRETRHIEFQDGFGLVDNNIFNFNWQPVRVSALTMYGGANNGDHSWADDTSGPGGADAVFFEDNMFHQIATGNDYFANIVDCEGGGRVVIRYNDLDNTKVLNHGPEKQSRRRGCKIYEVYENHFDITTPDDDLWVPVNIKSGTAVIFSNVFDSKYTGDRLNIQYDRLVAASNIWGYCDGSHIYDQNAAETDGSGSHDGSSGASTLTDTGQSWSSNEWSGYEVWNTTDGSHGTVSANTAATVSANLSGGADNDWDAGDQYVITDGGDCLDQPGRLNGGLETASDPDDWSGYPDQELWPLYEWNNQQEGGADYDWYADSPYSDYIFENVHYFDDTRMPGYTPYTYPHPLR
jgi:hypothetical protein